MNAGEERLRISACATTGSRLDLCKHAQVRRTVYSTAIVAADAYAASGRPVSSELLLGRQAAVTALAVLDGTCPAPRA